MGLFTSKKNKIEQIQNNFADVLAKTLASSEMSAEEKDDLISQVHESLEEYTPDDIIAISVRGCKQAFEIILDRYKNLTPIYDRIFKAYTEFNESVELNELEILPFDFIRSIVVEAENEQFLYSMTPDECESWYREQKKNGQMFEKELFKKIHNRIGIKYEAKLLEELKSVDPKNIDAWIYQKKKHGFFLTTKVYDKAMSVSRGEQP